jgi:hypothetical protein
MADVPANHYQPIDTPYTAAPAASPALQPHLRVKDLAALWGFCENTIIKLFANEPGVLRPQRFIGKRKYTTLSIPQSVAVRVHERLSQQPLQAAFSTTDPLGVVRLRDSHTRMPKQSRDVVKLKPGKQFANRERVA